MFLARVTGSIVATQKALSMTGQKLLIVEPLRVDPLDRSRLVGTGRSFVAVDSVGAGSEQIVLIVQGSSARLTPQTEKLPIDTAIIGIVDTVQVGDNTVFDAEAGHQLAECQGIFGVVWSHKHHPVAPEGRP